MPVSFSLDLGGAVIDPSSTYTIQATIVDGDDAWVTAKGVPVLTKGNPSKVAITLDFRPDVLKGAVTGQITGIGVQPSATAYAITVLMDPATGDSLGIDVKTVDQGLPVAFSVPYSIGDIQPTADYVVTAEVGDSTGIVAQCCRRPGHHQGQPEGRGAGGRHAGLDAGAERDARPGTRREQPRSRRGVAVMAGCCR